MRTALVLALVLASYPLLAQDQGTIIFFREPQAMTGYYKPTLFCDRKELAQIENGTYFQVTAPTGPHTCAVESSDQSIDLNVVTGETIYVHVKKLPTFKDRVVLLSTTEDEYNKQKKRLKPVREWSHDSLLPQADNVPRLSEAPTPTPQRSKKPERIVSSCLIVNARPARADESAWVAFNGKVDPTDLRYDYIDSLHLQDHLLTFKKTDLDKLEKTGTRVIVLDRQYTAEHLAAARDSCKAIDAATIR